jgi:hypothetical protein
MKLKAKVRSSRTGSGEEPDTDTEGWGGWGALLGILVLVPSEKCYGFLKDPEAWEPEKDVLVAMTMSR